MNMNKPTTIVSRVWVLRDKEGKGIDDIDTDQIYHNVHLAVTDIDEMGQYALGNLKGWQDFPEKAKRGDIVIAGRNFGSGSSRQQAVDCFRSLGVSLLIAESFGAIYKRNAINSGFPILVCEGITGNQVRDGEEIEVNLETGHIFNRTANQPIEGGEPFSRVQMDIYQAGNLFDFGKKAVKG